MKKLEDKKTIKGREMGRRLGFPTLNFPLEKEEKIKRGVWAIILEAESGFSPGVANVGKAKTFSEKEEVIEVHLLSQPKKIVKRANIIFLKYLRRTKKFNNVESLKEQIKKDVERAISFFRKERKRGRTLNIPFSF